MIVFNINVPIELEKEKLIELLADYYFLNNLKFNHDLKVEDAFNIILDKSRIFKEFKSNKIEIRFYEYLIIAPNYDSLIIEVSQWAENNKKELEK